MTTIQFRNQWNAIREQFRPREIATSESSTSRPNLDDSSATGDIGLVDWIGLDNAVSDRRKPEAFAGALTASQPQVLNESAELSASKHSFQPLKKSSVSSKLPKDRVRVVQHWECIISDVDDEVVYCEMHDLINPSSPVEFAELYIEEFNTFDRPVLTEGTVFYWSVGHLQQANGIIKGLSEIRLRRTPRLSKTVQKEITRKASELSDLFTHG